MAASTESTAASVVKASPKALAESFADLASGKVRVISSIQGTDRESRRKVLDGITNSVPLSESLGKTINLIDVTVQIVELENESTGEVADQPRITLIDADGTSYHATSPSLLNRLEVFFGILGEPSEWGGEPEPVKVVKKKSGKYEFFDMVSA